MGAMHNDLERCQFMYSDDRRCRNLIETPTSQLCCYHNKAAQKKSDGAAATHPAATAFFEWLSHHPLDTVTHINEALNQVFLLVVANAIPARQAESLVRMARLLLKTVPHVRDEYRIPSLLNHSPGGQRFLSEIRPTVLAAALPDPPVPEDPFTSSTSSTSSTPSPSSAPAPVAATFRSPACSAAPSPVVARSATLECGGSAAALPSREAHLARQPQENHATKGAANSAPTAKREQSSRTPKSPTAAGDARPGDLKVAATPAHLDRNLKPAKSLGGPETPRGASHH